MVGLAAMVNEIKRFQYGIDKQESFDEKLINAIDRSGVLGFMFDVNNAVEKVSSNNYGVRPLLTDKKGGYMPFGAKAGSVFGPSASNLINFGNIVGDVLSGNADEKTLQSTRYITPFGNYPPIDPLLDRLYGK